MEAFDFCFKGSRTYVHGSDMYHLVMQHISRCQGYDGGRFDMTIHKVVTHNMDARVVSAADAVSSVMPAVRCKFEGSEGVTILDLEESDREIGCRYDYDEEGIISRSSFAHDSATVSVVDKIPYSPIEIVIALNRRLVQTHFAREAGKWFFCKLSLVRKLPNSNAGTFGIALEKTLGPRLTSSRITINDILYGDIYFSLVRP